MNSTTWLYMNLSKILEKHDEALHKYFYNWQILLGSPDLKIGTTLANFNSLGNIPSSIDLLMRYVNGFT